jgi:chromosome segregation ATPase
MSDDPNAQQSQSAPKETKISADISVLTGRVEALTKELAATQGQLKEISAERDNLKTSVSQLTEQSSKYTADLETTTAQLKQLNGEKATFQTQVEQLNAKLTDSTQNLTGTQRELEMYKLISETPEYHDLVGVVSTIKVVADPDEQKKILDLQAQNYKRKQEEILSMVQAGATPPAGPAVQQQPAPRGPSTLPEVHARLNAIAGQPGAQAEVAQLTGMALELQNNSAGATLPA